MKQSPPPTAMQGMAINCDTVGRNRLLSACLGGSVGARFPCPLVSPQGETRRFAPQRRISILRAFLCFGLLLLCFNPAHAQESLSSMLDKTLNTPALKGGITGAIVCRVNDGKALYEHNADTRLLPASNRKLFTSAAALELLGDDFQVTTDICALAKPDADGVIQGDLYLRGAGDGLLSRDDLDAMAQALRKMGVKRIEGRVVGDGTRFTDGPYGFGWEWDDFSDEEFPQISALEVNEGVLSVHVTPGAKVGDPVTATLVPPTAYLSVHNSAVTGAKDASLTCEVTRPWDKNDFVTTGTLPLGKAEDTKVPVQNPPLFAATLLSESLERQKITFVNVGTGRTPPGAIVLTSHPSLPLSQYVVRMNKPSDNLLAESLIRDIGVVKGAGGTYDTGHAAEMPFFKSLGVGTASIALVDGCGVGRRNFVTARAVSQLLLGMHREKNWQIYYDSLPIAGVDGTLKDRFRGTPAEANVHAKTGTLSQVRALSGYFTGKSGNLYVFSLLMNNFPGTARQAGAVQDRFVEQSIAAL